MSAAWALAMPLNGFADESEHIARAYAVVSGQGLGSVALLSDGHVGTFVEVPNTLLPLNSKCMYQFDGEHRSGAACLEAADGPGTHIASSWTGRYHPLYYAVTGFSLRWLPNMTGVYIGRLISAGQG